MTLSMSFAPGRDGWHPVRGGGGGENVFAPQGLKNRPYLRIRQTKIDTVINSKAQTQKMTPCSRENKTKQHTNLQ